MSDGPSGQSMVTSAPPALAEATTASSRRMLCSPSENEASRGSPVHPGDLLEEGPGLEGEQVVLPVADPGEVHRHAAGDVRVVRARPAPGGSPFGRAGARRRRSRTRRRGPGRRWPPPCEANSSKPRELARPKAAREADRVPVAPDSNVAVKVTRSSFSTGSVTSLTSAAAWPTAAPSGEGALGDEGGQHRAPDRLDGAAHELGQVDQVAADVGQGARARSALVAPAHRAPRVDPVVAPVVAVEVQRPADGAGGELLADGADGGGAAEHEADAGLAIRRPGGGHHGLGVLDGRRHRLLAEHVLAGGQQALDDPAVERVGHDHADHVDVVGGGDRPPSRSRPARTRSGGRCRRRRRG